MFSAFIGHGPLYKSKRKNVGKLFTPVVTVAFVLLVAILLVCILAPVVAPYDPNAQDLTQVLAKPSAAHWLGCDQTGRDIFSRIIYGGRTALVSAVMVVVISVIIGIPLGLISGYKGGLADTIIMRCCDILLSFPSLLLAFVLVAGLGRNTFNAVLALGIVYVPMLTRLTRSLTLVEKNILRLGIYEITEFDTPQIVAVNEAVELAKAFSDETSSRFVNGVLSQFVTEE